MEYIKLYKDIIWICKGHYDHDLYENELAALEAFYHLSYSPDIKLTEELANEVFLYPTFDYIVRSCATMKHFSLQFLFHKTTQEILAERDHIINGKELLDFNLIPENSPASVGSGMNSVFLYVKSFFSRIPHIYSRKNL